MISPLSLGYHTGSRRTLTRQVNALSIPWSFRIVTYPVGSASGFLKGTLTAIVVLSGRVPSFDLVSFCALMGVRHLAPRECEYGECTIGLFKGYEREKSTARRSATRAFRERMVAMLS